MDPIQYQEICDFLLHKKYPDHIDSKGLKSNFRRKVVKFRINEENIPYQVSSINLLINDFNYLCSIYIFRKFRIPLEMKCFSNAL